MYIGIGIFAVLAVLVIVAFIAQSKRRRNYEATGDDRLQ